MYISVTIDSGSLLHVHNRMSTFIFIIVKSEPLIQAPNTTVLERQVPVFSPDILLLLHLIPGSVYVQYFETSWIRDIQQNEWLILPSCVVKPHLINLLVVLFLCITYEGRNMLLMPLHTRTTFCRAEYNKWYNPIKCFSSILLVSKSVFFARAFSTSISNYLPFPPALPLSICPVATTHSSLPPSYPCTSLSHHPISFMTCITIQSMLSPRCLVTDCPTRMSRRKDLISSHCIGPQHLGDMVSSTVHGQYFLNE